jgi:hypothetical protein
MLHDVTIQIVKFWSCYKLTAGLCEISRAAETWCRIHTPVVLTVPLPQGISSIILVFVTVTRFTTSYHGMYYLSLLTDIHS